MSRSSLLGVMLLAVAVRLPALASSMHLGFDDGVFGASALAMRDGATPFRDIFSSQGPLFLPLVWLADLIGLRSFSAPRLLAIAAGVVIVAATAAAARRLATSHLDTPRIGDTDTTQSANRTAFLAAVLAATSGSLLWVTGPLTSDGPALAAATVSVAIALRYHSSHHHIGHPDASHPDRSNPWWIPIAMGLAIGVALSVKSLLIAAAVPVGLALLARCRWRDIALATGTALAVGLTSTLAWGFSRVWDQSVAYHLEAAGERTPVANARKLIATMWSRDPLILLLVIAVLGVALVGIARVPRGQRFRRSHSSALSDEMPSGNLLAWSWFLATAVVLATEHPLWRNHVSHLVPPILLLVAPAAVRLMSTYLPTSGALRKRSRPLILTAAVAPLAVMQLASLSPLLRPTPYAGDQAHAVVEDLRSLPSGAWAISDEPGLVWSARRRTPADLVDTSILRIDSGRITSASLAMAADDPRVCAVVVWSSRFGDLEDLPDRLRLEDFYIARHYGRSGKRLLYVKTACLRQLLLDPNGQSSARRTSDQSPN